MTDNGTYISVEAEETDLKQLLKTISEDHRSIRILSQGQPVADLSPVPLKRQLKPVDPGLKVKFSPDYDPIAPLSEDEWPSHLR